MNSTCILPLLAALSGALSSAAVLAQASAPAATTASAPAPRATVGPRVMSPSQQHRNADAAAPPGLRPERPVVPQINIPLGRKPPNPAPAASQAPRNGAATPPGQIGDTAARCEALTSDQERAACRKRLARSQAPG